MIKKPTIQDVAALANVSKSAVSRYFNNPDLINKDYKNRIKKAIKELNYKPSSSARNLRLGNNNIVGYVMPDISQEFFASTMKCLNSELFQKNCLLISCDSNNDPERERSLINMLLQQDVLALVVVTCGNNTEFLKELSAKYPNLILLIRHEPEVNCDSIFEDQSGNSYKLTNHMISKGCKNFGVLYGIPYSSATSQGMEGIRKSLAKNNLKIDNNNVTGNCFDYKTSKAAAEKMLENDPSIDCLMYINQRSANGIYRAVRNFNKKYGKNVQMAGFASSSIMDSMEHQFPAIIEDPDSTGQILADFTISKIFSESKSHVPTKLKLQAKDNFNET